MARPRDTNKIQSLQMARMHIVDGRSYSEIATKFNLGTKNTVCNRLKEVKAEYPELIKMFNDIAEYQITPTEAAPIIAEQMAPLEVMLDDNKSLADKLQAQVEVLMDIPAHEIRAMKPEHRLRHVSNLIQSMRLLKEESTANVKTVSLIQCIGIATERRKPKNTDN